MTDLYNPDLANLVFTLLSVDEIFVIMMNKDTSTKQKTVLLILAVVGLKETYQIKLVSFTEQ